MDKGFIKLNRKFFSHRMWEAARTFSECEAWIDLLQSARFEATERIERIGGREICFGKGQYPASNRYLAQRWKWGEQRVKTFLGRLKTEGMISISNSQGMNVITLLDFDGDNDKNPPKNPTNNPSIELILKELEDLKTQLATHQTTQCQPSGNPNLKKEKKEEERNTNTPYNPPKGYERFNFDFLDHPFKESFFLWLAYKTGRGQRYNNQVSIELCYKQLVDKSAGNTLLATRIVEQSMANNWSGLFELKEQKDADNKHIKQNDDSKPNYSIAM